MESIELAAKATPWFVSLLGMTACGLYLDQQLALLKEPGGTGKAAAGLWVVVSAAMALYFLYSFCISFRLG